MNVRYYALLIAMFMLCTVSFSAEDTVTIFYPVANSNIETPTYNVTYIFNGGVKNSADCTCYLDGQSVDVMAHLHKDLNYSLCQLTFSLGQLRTRHNVNVTCVNTTTESADADFTVAYLPKYSSTEVGYTVQDTIGSLFDSLASNASLVVIVIIGILAIVCAVYIFMRMKGI
jgi:hypothetical protein